MLILVEFGCADQDGEITNLRLADYGLGKNGAPGEIRTPDPLVRSQMLYPAELRAQHETISGDFDYSGNSRIHEDEGGGGQTIRHTVNTLCPALSIFFLTLSMNFRHHSCLRVASVNLSHRGQFLLGLPAHALCVFR